jgi:hypothetical protein
MIFLTSVGGGVVARLECVRGLTTRWIKGVSAIPRVLPFMGKRGLWNAASRQMYPIGVTAIPMVAIPGACAGLILAIQSATILNQLPRTAVLFGGITGGGVSRCTARLAPGATIPSQEALSTDDLQRKVAVPDDTAQTVLVQVTGNLNGFSGDTCKQLTNLGAACFI